MSEEMMAKYFAGLLSETEKVQLEQRLLGEPEFARQFEEEKLLWQSREVLVADRLRKELIGFEKSRTSARIWQGIAIAFIILSFIISILLMNSRQVPSPIENKELGTPPNEPKSAPIIEEARPVDKPKTEVPEETPGETKKLSASKNNQQFAMELYEQGPNWSTTRGQESQDSGQLAIIAYLDGDYKTSLSLLENNRLVSTPLREIQAHALMHLDRFNEASVILKEIADSRQIPYFERSQWYFILSQIAMGNWSSAVTKNMIDEILADPEHEYYGNLKTLVENEFFR